jgi:hypothetical protein
VDNKISYSIGKSSYYIAETFNVSEKIENNFWEEYG